PIHPLSTKALAFFAYAYTIFGIVFLEKIIIKTKFSAKNFALALIIIAFDFVYSLQEVYTRHNIIWHAIANTNSFKSDLNQSIEIVHSCLMIFGSFAAVACWIAMCTKIRRRSILWYLVYSILNLLMIFVDVFSYYSYWSMTLTLLHLSDFSIYNSVCDALNSLWI
uniref:Uncharacterized protein n=1 Tax=Pristionchus pacificus TaxID=54126 RepID=A0A8R1YRN0_PRIPA